MSELPTQFISTGSDRFQVLLDKQMRSLGHDGNVGRLILKLTAKGLTKIVRERINSDFFIWLNQIQYRSQFAHKNSYWKRASQYKAPNFMRHYKFVSEAELLSQAVPDLQPNRAPLFQIDLHPSMEDFYLVFAWNHALCDARGAENIALFLAGFVEEIETDNLFPNIKKQSKIEILNQAKEAKTQLFEKREWPVCNLIEKKKSKSAGIIYQVINCSLDETNQIDDHAKQLVRFGKSPYYLAGTAVAFSELLERKNIKQETMMIPVPQDQRLKGSPKPVLTNQVSYLFYRLEPENYKDVASCAKSISKQMMEQIKNRFTHQYGSMLTLFKRMPLFIYDKFSEGPTKGKLASFFFSDTGESLNNIEGNKELGIQLLDAIHLPPPSLYPGLTCIFMKFKNQLKITLAASDKALSKEELSEFSTQLKSILLQ